MKKTMALVLCAIMMISLFCGCGPADQPGDGTQNTEPANVEHSLRVGFGRSDITPETFVPLGGGSGNISYSVEEPLYLNCVAITDETDNTILVYMIDLLQSYGDFAIQRRAISKATGVDELQIMFAATHNHTGPNLNSTNDPSIQLYVEGIKDKVVQAAVDAMADRKPVTGMYTTKTYTEDMNFVRHYMLKDGTRIGWATPAVQGNKNGTIKDHLLPADNELQLVKFVREGGKDIIMMNFQGHPRAKQDTIRSQVDAIRREIEPALDCHFTYFLGASGNVNSTSKITGRTRTQDHLEHGKMITEYAVEAAKNFKEVKVGKVQLIQNKVMGVSSNGNTEVGIQLYAFSFGDVAFTTAPYEMFTENGQKIKAESPFETTFVATCSNGSLGYLPSEYAFEYDCYEVSVTKFVKGTAEQAVAEHISLLKSLYETNN